MQRLCQPLRCSYVCIDHTSTYRFLRVSLSILSRPPGSQLSIRIVNRVDDTRYMTVYFGDRPKNRKQTLRSSHLYRFKTYRSRISRSLTRASIRGVENCCVARTRAHAPLNARPMNTKNIAKSARNRKDVASKLFTPRKPRFIFSSLVCMYIYNVYCYCLFISTANISSFYTTYTHASMYEMSNE